MSERVLDTGDVTAIGTAAHATAAPREELVRQHEGLARSVAARYAHRGEPLDDLVQVAFIGLLKAFERYDASHGTRFSTYAVATIDGELKRYLRDRAWTIRTPRAIKELYLRAKQSTDALTQQLGRRPTPAEIADDADASPAEVATAHHAGRNLRPASLDVVVPVNGGDRPIECGAPDLGHDRVDDRDEVDRLLSELPPQWQAVVRLRFLGELSQAEIAEQIGVSQVQVSRILARSLAQLGGRSEADDGRSMPSRPASTVRWKPARGAGAGSSPGGSAKDARRRPARQGRPSPGTRPPRQHGGRAAIAPDGGQRGEERTMNERLLLVEDDDSLRESVSLLCQRAGWRVECERDGKQAVERFMAERFDLVLLDLMLPSLDGFEVCRSIRRVSRVPIVMLTARTDTPDLVAGLELGADDYVTKPFEAAELVARVRAVLRRVAPGPEGAPQVIAGLEIDPEAFTVRKHGRELHLSATEFRLLLELVRNAGLVLTREMLLERVWNYDYMGDSRLVDMAIKRLRDKVEDDSGEPRRIVTVRGVGYRFDPNAG